MAERNFHNDLRFATIYAELGIDQGLISARGLPIYTEAAQLIVAETTCDDRQHLLLNEAAQAWQALKTAAFKDSVYLYIVSAYRSVDKQVELIQRKLKQGIPLENILSLLAPPGCSEHHTGRAVDLSATGAPIVKIEFEQSLAFSWLMDCAPQFGYTLSYPKQNTQGYQYEPWHWCFH